MSSDCKSSGTSTFLEARFIKSLGNALPKRQKGRWHTRNPRPAEMLYKRKTPYFSVQFRSYSILQKIATAIQSKPKRSPNLPSRCVCNIPWPKETKGTVPKPKPILPLQTKFPTESLSFWELQTLHHIPSTWPRHLCPCQISPESVPKYKYTWIYLSIMS